MFSTESVLCFSNTSSLQWFFFDIIVCGDIFEDQVGNYIWNDELQLQREIQKRANDAIKPVEDRVSVRDKKNLGKRHVNGGCFCVINVVDKPGFNDGVAVGFNDLAHKHINHDGNDFGPGINLNAQKFRHFFVGFLGRAESQNCSFGLFILQGKVDHEEQ